MITLHHCMSARSFRPLWMLEELGLPYTLKMLPFPPRALARDYLEINPLGTVPLLEDGELRMSESVAICQYLVARQAQQAPTPLNVAVTEPGFGSWLNWLHFGEATLTFPQTLVLRYSRFEPARSLQAVADDYTRWFLARLRVLDGALAQQPFLCAGRFTAADVSVGYALMLAEHLALEPRFSPAVRDYWQRLKSREAFQRAMKAQRQAAVDQGVSTVAAPDTRPA